jgi:MFS family permease
MAALMVPQVMSLMQVMYKPEERSNIMGLFGMLGGLSASLGPIVGGLLIKANIFGWDWRPIFLINLPVGIFALIAGSKYLPEGKSEHPLHIDLKGTFLIIIALSLLIFPLIEGRDLDWPIWSLVMIAAAIPALWFFGWYETRKHKRDQSALIVPSLFKLRSFNSGLVLNVILQSVMIGYFLTFTLILQVGLGFSAIRAALTGVPTAVGMSISFIVLSQRLIRRYGRNVIPMGCALFASGLIITSAVLTHYGFGTHAWMFIPSVFLTGLGLALIMAPVFSAALQDVDPSHAGSASGILSAVQQVGGAIGIAIIGVIFFGQISHGSVTGFNAVAPQMREKLTALQVPAYAQEGIIDGVRDCYRDRTAEKDSTVVPQSCKKFGAGGTSTSTADNAAYQAVGTVISDTVKQANARNFASAFRWSIIYVLILLTIACALSFTLPRKLRVVQENA